MKPTEQPETTSPPIDTPSEADAQQAAVDAYVVHCEECVWWLSDDDTDEGKCHRHAPRPTTSRPGVGWATTKRTDFCGDAELKPDPLTPMKMN